MRSLKAKQQPEIDPKVWQAYLDSEREREEVIAVLLIPNFLNKSAILSIHARQIEKFGWESGCVRDEGLLESALAQPQASFGGELLHPTIQDQAATYFYHLAMNHPFIDGNKRTAFARWILFYV